MNKDDILFNLIIYGIILILWTIPIYLILRLL